MTSDQNWLIVDLHDSDPTEIEKAEKRLYTEGIKQGTSITKGILKVGGTLKQIETALRIINDHL